MAYTGGEIVDLTTGALVGSTIAKTNIVGSDTYARRLNVSGAEVTVTDLKVSSGGSVFLYAGAVNGIDVTGKNDVFRVSGGTVENARVYNGGSMFVTDSGVVSNVILSAASTPKISVGANGGGTVDGLKTSGTVEVYVNAGGTLKNIEINPNAYTYLSSGTIEGGYVNGVTFQVSAGTVSSVTIYKRTLRTDPQGWRDQMAGGTMIDCTLATSEGATGAIFRQTGGANNNFTVTGSGAVFYASGGTVNNVTVTKGGTLELSNSAVVNDVHAVRDGRTTTVRVNSGGTINGIDNDGEMQIIINNSGTVNDMMLGANAFVFVNNGAVVSGGSTWGVTLEINGADAVVEDLTILKPTQRSDKYAGNDQMKAGTMSNCVLTVREGATAAVYRQTGGTNIGMTVTGAGAEFNVSGGTLTGTTVTSGGELNVWGGTFTDTTIESGGALYASDGEFTDLTVKNRSFLYLRGATVNNLQMLSAGSHPNVQVSSGAVINGGANTGTAEFWVYNGGVAKDMTLNAGAYVMMNAGGTLSGGTFDGAMLEIMGGTVRGVTILKADSGTAGRNLLKSGKLIDCTIAAGGLYRVSGGTATNTKVSGTFNISAGTVDGVTVYDGGQANISAAATGVVESGGYVNIVNNAEVSFVETALENHTFTKAATLHEATTADNAIVASGAALHVVGGQANNATVEAGGNMVVSSGVVRDLTLNSGAVLDFAEGAWAWGEGNFPTVTGVTVNSGAQVNLKNFTRLMDFTVVSGAVLKRESNRIGFGGSNTNIAKGVFFDAKGVEEKSFGEDFQVVNGVATGLELNGNNPRSCAHIYSGLTVENAQVVSGGSVYVFSGAAIDGIGIYGSRIVGTSTYQAYMYASNAGIDNAVIGVGGSAEVRSGAVLNDLTISGGAVNIFSGVTANNVTLVSGAGVRGTLGIGTGATVNTLNLALKGDLYVNGGTVNNLIVTNGGNTPTFYVYNGGTVVGGKTTGTCEVRASGGGVISGMDIGAGAYVHIRSTGSAAGVLSDCVFNGVRLNIYEGGIMKGVTIAKADTGETTNALRGGKMIDCTIASGAQYKMSGGVAENTLVKGTFLVRGGVASDLRTSGNRAFVNISSGGVVSGALIEDYAHVTVSKGGVLYAPVIRMNAPTSITSGGYDYYARIDVRGGLVEGGRTEGGNTLEVYVYDDGVIRDMTFNKGGYCGVLSGATISGGTLKQGGTFSVRGGTVEGATISGGNAVFTAAGGTITGAKVVSGTIAAANGTVLDTDITANGSMTVYGTAKNVTGVTVSKGGTLIVGGTGKANGVTAGEGANILVDLDGKTATAANFDTLANIDKVTIAGVKSPEAGEYLLADVGRDDFKVGVVGSGVFEGEVAAGGTWENPFIQRGFALSADGRTLTVGTASRTAVTEAATFAQSGTVINGGDKELMWDGATVTGAVKLIDTDAAAAISGDAWMDIRACSVGEKAAIYGTDVNVNFSGKVRYQLHGTGDTVGNFAGGANYGGSVKGVEMLTYNTTYTGVGYAGGFGTVENDVDVIFAGGNTLNKDFYAGALANYNKTGLTTGVGSVKAQIGEKTTDKITVKGNFYGASAVKAGTISTTAATTPLHTVGDVSVTLLAGTAADSKFCLFAGGYATGTDSAKLAAVYTVENVNATVEGGSWGSANGGRGIFGGIFASGVKAAAGDVTLTVSGGTMGNVYGGGWSQKDGVSVVGDVELTITGGKMANVFGGGTHSTSGGATEAGNVTITVSGGTISGNIYARGQLSDDMVANSTVIFTGAKDFGCGVYGYSYVGGSDESNAELGFSDYSGTFSGAIGGFKNITLGGDTTMTLTADAESVSNTAWVFDTAERYTAFAHTAILDWSAADFTGDTIAINLATGSTAEWDLVSAAATTVYNKFDVLVDGASILSEAIDIDDVIAGTGTVYDGWGFTVEDDTLKFAKLA